jgi:hypothetical protein
MRSLIFLMLAAVAAASGCGETEPPRTVVTGVVTYQGKPLPTGSVAFVPTGGNGRPIASAIDAEGRYRLETAAGSYEVQVQMIGRLRSEPAPTGEGAKLDIPVVDWLIPEKYAKCQTSGLAATVEAGDEQKIDFPLQ